MSGADVLGRIAHAADVLEAGGMGTVTVADLRGALAAVAELIEALEGMVSIHDSVTMRQESERRDEWLPKARAALSNITGAKS